LRELECSLRSYFRRDLGTKPAGLERALFAHPQINDLSELR
jgi:hypothetical protein